MQQFRRNSLGAAFPGKGGKQLIHLFNKYLLGTCYVPVLSNHGRVQESS